MKPRREMLREQRERGGDAVVVPTTCASSTMKNDGGPSCSSSSSSNTPTASARMPCRCSTARVGSPQPGTSVRIANTTLHQNWPTSRSVSSSDRHAVAAVDSATQPATSVVLPAPAGATTRVSGARVTSSRRHTGATAARTARSSPAPASWRVAAAPPRTPRTDPFRQQAYGLAIRSEMICTRPRAAPLSGGIDPGSTRWASRDAGHPDT